MNAMRQSDIADYRCQPRLDADEAARRRRFGGSHPATAALHRGAPLGPKEPSGPRPTSLGPAPTGDIKARGRAKTPLFCRPRQPNARTDGGACSAHHA